MSALPGDRDVDVLDDSFDAAGDYAHYDFGKHSGSACEQDAEREPDGHSTRGGLHVGDQQFAAVGSGEPVGNFQRDA